MFILRLLEYIFLGVSIPLVFNHIGKVPGILFVVLYSAFLVYRYYRYIPKCKKCNKKMKIKRIEDPLSMNVTNKIRISFIQTKGIPIKEKTTYLCKTCNTRFIKEGYGY